MNTDVIKGLECCSKEFKCEDCPYKELKPFPDDWDCVVQMAKDALELIRKEQVRL